MYFADRNLYLRNGKFIEKLFRIVASRYWNQQMRFGCTSNKVYSWNECEPNQMVERQGKHRWCAIHWKLSLSLRKFIVVPSLKNRIIRLTSIKVELGAETSNINNNNNHSKSCRSRQLKSYHINYKKATSCIVTSPLAYKPCIWSRQ